MSHATVKTFGPHLLSIWQKSEIHIIMFASIFASSSKLIFSAGFSGGLERVGKFVFNRCRPVCPGSTADHAKYSQTELKNKALEQAWYLHQYMLICPMHFYFLIFL